MTFLAIDYGTKKIGLAASVESVALPLCIIATKNIFRELPEIVRERQIDTIVVGIADHMDGRISEQSVRTRSFIGKLASIVPKSVRIVEWDERLTTNEARLSMTQMGNKDPRAQIDDIAASILLQSYIDRHTS